MLDLIFITLLFILAALLCCAAREIFRSLRRRHSTRNLFPCEMVVAREGTIRHEGGRVYVRLNRFDDCGGRAQVVAGTALRRGQRRCARPQVPSSTTNAKGGLTEETIRRI